MKAKGYSIWLIPTGEIYQKLSKIISQLSRKHSAPNFEPHVTLIGDLLGSEKEIIDKTSELAKSLEPFEIKLNKAGYLDNYWRCLFIQAEKTKELIQANKITKKIFNRTSDPEYFPHLSLMYGDFSSKTKEEILADLGKEFDTSFEIKSLHLISTTGEVKDWYRVREFLLK
jgi:2'-5' RNA ligase